MSAVISALPVRNNTSPCSPSRTSEASSLAVWAVLIFCDRSSSLALKVMLVSASCVFSVRSADFSVCNSDLSLSSMATCASAFLASLARWTRLPSQVPSPAPTTAPIGPAAKAPITAPDTNPTGSWGGRVLGSPAKATALTPIRPIVQTNLEYLVLMTTSSLLASRGDDRRLMGAITAPHWDDLRVESWQIMAKPLPIAGRQRPGPKRVCVLGFEGERREIGIDVVVILVFGFL